MARAGAFDDLAAALMVHPAGVDAVGVRTLCIADASVTFHGRAAHAAVNPSGGRNALDAAVSAYQAVAALRQHLPSGDLINAVIVGTDSAPNVIPAKAGIAAFLRSPRAATLAAQKLRFEDCMQGAARQAGCTAAIDWAQADYLDFKFNETLATVYQHHAESFDRFPYPMEKLPLGGTDMGNVSHRVPSLHPLIRCAPPDVLIHEPQFTRWAASPDGDRAVLDGAACLALTALSLLTEPALLDRAAAEFAETAESSSTAVTLAYRAQGRAASAGCC